MITIYDIAKEVGCSSATVSKALNNYSDVSEKTRKKIIEVAEAMHYSPNSQAQSLTKKKTWNIGVLFEVENSAGLTHIFFAEILQSFKEYVEKLGYDLTFVSKKIGSEQVSFLQHVKRRRCDGVIIANYDYDNQKILELINSKMPLVVIDFNYDTVSSILSDNYEGIKMLTQYLVDMNHRNIVYYHGQDTYVTKVRIKGFKDTLIENGIDFNDNHLVEGVYYVKGNTETLREILRREDRPTAIMFSDDHSAAWGSKVIKEMGLNIPEDISIAGFDGTIIGEMISPTLTTVKQDTKTIGQQAAKRLIDIIETKNGCKVDVHVGVELIKGESVKRL